MSKSSSMHGTTAAPDPLAFRPTSYIADGSIAGALLQNIVGEGRRSFLRFHLDMVAQRSVRLIASEFLESHLDPTLREGWVDYDPLANSPGEFLPPYLRREVEIARVVVNTTPNLVFSVRARRAGRRLRYRMVDAHGTMFSLSRQSSVRYLTTRELIALIDGATAETGDTSGDTFSESLLHSLRCACVVERPRHRAIRATSDVYPMLERCFTQHVADRIADRKFEKRLLWRP